MKTQAGLQPQRTRTGTTIPTQRQPLPEGPAAPTPAAPAPGKPGSRWEAHSWATVVRVSVSRGLLAVVVSLLVWSLLPTVLGWTPRVILSGSMEPRISTGDVVVTRPVSPAQLAEDQVLTTVDPDKPGTHRLVERGEDGALVTRGDANPQNDSTTVTAADVLVVGVLRVPYVGSPAYWLAHRDLLALGLGLAALSGLVLGAWTPQRPGRGGDKRGGGTGSAGGSHRPRRRAFARSRRMRRAGAVVTSSVGVVLSVALVAPGSYAAFAATVANPTSTLATASTFYPYRDAVVADSPSHYWRLDERDGTAVADSSGRGNHGTARGAGAWQQAGALASEPRSTSVLSNGASVTADTAVTANARFSFEAWVRTTTTRGGSIMTLGNGDARTYASNVERALYLQDDGFLRFGVFGSSRNGNGSTTIASTSRVNDGVWHHVVTTFSTGANPGLRLYVDGVLQARSTSPYTPIQRTGWYYRAGGENLVYWPGQPASQTLAGQLDELAVYDGTVLSADRVTAHLRAARNG